METPEKAPRRQHIILTSHLAGSAKSQPLPIVWGAKTAAERGPIVATTGEFAATIDIRIDRVGNSLETIGELVC